MKSQEPNSSMYVGKPCVHGHGNVRYNAGGACIVCSRLNSKKRWADRDEKWKKQRRDRYATDGGRADRRSRNLKKNYGLSIEDFDALAAAQKFCCDICGWEQTSLKKLVVDHNHKSGAIRSLLCHKCNVGLGSFNDSIVKMAAAIEYLRKHGEP